MGDQSVRAAGGTIKSVGTALAQLRQLQSLILNISDVSPAFSQMLASAFNHLNLLEVLHLPWGASQDYDSYSALLGALSALSKLKELHFHIELEMFRSDWSGACVRALQLLQNL